MATVNLDEREWQQVLSILSQQPWHIANPLLMKIGQQLQPQAQRGNNSAPLEHDEGLHPRHEN